MDRPPGSEASAPSVPADSSGPGAHGHAGPPAFAGGLEGEARLAEARKPLADEPTAKRNLPAIIRREQEDLRVLRAELWETVDRPALEAACQRAQTFDPSPEATLAFRYERSNALELSRCLNLLGRLKREARRAEADAPAASPGLVAEAPASFEASGAPNELQDGQNCGASSEKDNTCDSGAGASPASRSHPESVFEASSARPEGASEASRKRRLSLREAKRRRRGRR